MFAHVTSNTTCLLLQCCTCITQLFHWPHIVCLFILMDGRNVLSLFFLLAISYLVPTLASTALKLSLNRQSLVTTVGWIEV